MLNEVLLVGEILDEPEAGRHDTGYTTARCRLRVSEAKADGQTWYTSVPLHGFGRAADSMITLSQGATVVVRGQLRAGANHRLAYGRLAC
jgi:single-stranded DNA-binding protein